MTDGSHFFRGQVAKHLAPGLNDRIFILKDPAAQEILFEVPPEIFYRVKFRRVGRKRKESDVARYFQIFRVMPSSIVNNENYVFPAANPFAQEAQELVHD